MKTKAGDLLGSELTFFARYPEEMDLVYVDQIEDHRNLFNFLDNKQFQEMHKLVLKIGGAAADEAQEITSEVRGRLQNIIHIKARSIKKRCEWESGLKIKKFPQSKFGNVECRVVVETDGGCLVARVIIWVKGSKRLVLSKALNRAIGVPPPTPKFYGENTMVISAVNLREAVDRCRTKQSIIEELTSPLLKLTKKDWDKVFSLTSP